MTDAAPPMIEVGGLVKTFTLYNQGGVVLPVLDGVSLTVAAGETVVVTGASGAGKSSLLKCVYGTYRVGTGAVRVRHRGTLVDLATASPRTILAIRAETIGYVTQFLRVVPRVAALDIVAEPLRREGVAPGEARERAAAMLRRLNIPERLWPLAPATFSGGEQQRVNIARGFVVARPILLLDEPTAALDAENRAVVAELVCGAAARGAAILGIFHDAKVRDTVATRMFPIGPERSAA